MPICLLLVNSCLPLLLSCLTFQISCLFQQKPNRTKQLSIQNQATVHTKPSDCPSKSKRLHYPKHHTILFKKNQAAVLTKPSNCIMTRCNSSSKSKRQLCPHTKPSNCITTRETLLPNPSDCFVPHNSHNCESIDCKN